MWPIEGTAPDTLYLQAPGALRSSPTGGDGESVIRSDPVIPFTDPFNGDYGAHDYRDLPRREGIVVFETAPFEEAWEVIGQVVTELEVSASVPDYDL